MGFQLDCFSAIFIFLQIGLKDCFLTKGTPEILCHLACEEKGGM